MYASMQVYVSESENKEQENVLPAQADLDQTAHS